MCVNVEHVDDVVHIQWENAHVCNIFHAHNIK